MYEPNFEPSAYMRKHLMIIQMWPFVYDLSIKRLLNPTELMQPLAIVKDPKTSKVDENIYLPDPPIPHQWRPLKYEKKETCKICGKKLYSRGFCQVHYFRWRQTGHPLGHEYKQELFNQKFESIPKGRSRHRRKWREKEINEVLELRRQGWTHKMISRKIGRSVSAIQHMLNKRGLEWLNG